MSNFLTRALIEDSGYVIDRSLRFMSASSQSLSRTPAGVGNRKTWTLSFWLKRGEIPASLRGFLNAGSLQLYWNSDGTLVSDVSGTGTFDSSIAAFKDPSAWYHFVWRFDTTDATAANRSRMFINGQELTLTKTRTFTLNADYDFNNTVLHRIGIGNPGGPTTYFDGYLSEIYLIDGQALTPSSFGEINPATGQWVAKKYTGTYGTNGFYLDFKDGTSTTTLGQDKSGNGNNWTLTNFTRSAGVNDCWMKDVPAGNGSASAVQPSGNYAVMNPLLNWTTNGTVFNVLNANLRVSEPGSTTYGSVAATIPFPKTGKWYAEINAELVGASLFAYIGITKTDSAAGYPGQTSASYAYRANGKIVNNGSEAAYGASWTTGDNITVVLDMDAGTLTFYKNNVSQGVAFSGLTADYYLVVGDFASTQSNTFNVNFGQRSFAYTPPTGFKALCTANLPTPSIKKPSEHFDIKLSTGANIKTDAEALFTNELEWIKDRANANNHQLIDSVRGSSAVLQSNTTAAETTYTAPSGSSVGWVWRASDSAAVTNNNGSISSQVSANVTAGFSIVTYTGTGVNATVGHGLGIAPKMIIFKNRLSGTTWVTYHASISPANFLQLNTTDANLSAATFAPFGSTPTATTSSVFYVGNNVNTNNSGIGIVAYCFAEIAGYSKFGSYTGNGSADGPFVHTGFRPAFVLIKNTSTAGPSWMLLDTVRNTFNITNLAIQPNATAAESTAGFTGLDVVSNGFKLRDTSSLFNTSGSNYIYMAFAETPFNYANAR